MTNNLKNKNTVSASITNAPIVDIFINPRSSALPQGPTIHPTSIITLHRRQLLCRITSGDISTLDPVTHVAIGDGGTDPLNPDTNGYPTPIMPNENMIDVFNRTALYPVTSISYPLDPAARTTAQYVLLIPPVQYGGRKINEAALIDAGGLAQAIITFYDKIKDPGVALRLTFNDIF